MFVDATSLKSEIKFTQALHDYEIIFSDENKRVSFSKTIECYNCYQFHDFYW